MQEPREKIGKGIVLTCRVERNVVFLQKALVCFPVCSVGVDADHPEICFACIAHADDVGGGAPLLFEAHVGHGLCQEADDILYLRLGNLVEEVVERHVVNVSSWLSVRRKRRMRQWDLEYLQVSMFGVKWKLLY